MSGSRLDLFTRLSEACCPCELKSQLFQYRKGRLPSKVGIYKGKLRYTGVQPVDEVTLCIENMKEIARFFATYINQPTYVNESITPHVAKVQRNSGSTRYHKFPRNLQIYLIRVLDPVHKRYLRSALTYKFYTDKKFRSNIEYNDIGNINSFPEFSIDLPSTETKVFTLGEILPR